MNSAEDTITFDTTSPGPSIKLMAPKTEEDKRAIAAAEAKRARRRRRNLRMQTASDSHG